MAPPCLPSQAIDDFEREYRRALAEGYASIGEPAGSYRRSAAAIAGERLGLSVKQYNARLGRLKLRWAETKIKIDELERPRLPSGKLPTEEWLDRRQSEFDRRMPRGKRGEGGFDGVIGRAPWRSLRGGRPQVNRGDAGLPVDPGVQMFAQPADAAGGEADGGHGGFNRHAESGWRQADIGGGCLEGQHARNPCEAGAVRYNQPPAQR